MIWICAYFGVLLILRRHNFVWNTSPCDYHAGGRRATAWQIALSISATAIGGSATIGMIGLAWQVGWPAFWWLGSGIAGLVLLGFLLARKVRITGAYTLPEIVGTYLCAQCRPLASLIILAAYLAINAAQFSAMGAIITSLSSLNQESAIITGNVIVFFYTCAGGQKAVIHSDLWQFSLLLIALLFALLFLLRLPQCQHAITYAPLHFVNSDFPVSRLVYFLINIGGTFLIGPVLFGRLLSARNGNVAKKGTFTAAFWIFASSILIVILGLELRGLHIQPEKAEFALSIALEASFPEWARIIISLGLFSAVISSADSCLLATSSIAANDLLKRNGAGSARFCMLVLTIASCLMALGGQGILDLLLAANDVYVCGIAAPLFIALLFGRPHAMKSQPAIASLLCGGIFGLLAAIYKNPTLYYLGILASTFLCLGGLAPFILAEKRKQAGKPAKIC